MRVICYGFLLARVGSHENDVDLKSSRTAQVEQSIHGIGLFDQIQGLEIEPLGDNSFYDSKSP